MKGGIPGSGAAMASQDAPFGKAGPVTELSARSFAPMSATRLLLFGGIALILAGLIFGDTFAVFVLHQNAGRIGERMLAATHAVAAGDPATAGREFAAMGSLLENRGTKVDTHVHIIKFGYLALILALLQPYVALSERRKKRLAQFVLFGSVLLPVGVFLIHYVGLTYSPLESIGWASIFADFGGLVVMLACLGELAGLWSYFRGGRQPLAEEQKLSEERSWAGRALLSGGTLLILAGFLYGTYFATVDLYEHETRDTALLRTIADRAAGNRLAEATQAVNDYGALQGDQAVKIAAHSHIIEFGLMAILLAFVQPYIFLSERWKQRWAIALLLGGLGLPVFVLLELRWGLVAGGIADAFGLLVAVALTDMLVGVLRFSGSVDSGRETLR
jgi:hypothetical protein